MDMFLGDDIARLVEPDRVHRSVYTDPAIFDLEMERVFGRAWIYVGHESQIPAAGDYHQALIGRQSVFMVCMALALPILLPRPAYAWWARGGWGWGGVAVAVPPVVVAPPPVVVGPPVVAYAPPPVARWVPGHYSWRGFWVPGHWV